MRRPAFHMATGKSVSSSDPAPMSSDPITTCIEELKLTVGDVHYVLIQNPDNFLADSGFRGHHPTLSTVLVTEPGQAITRSALQDFRALKLKPDDVFQPEFCSNIVFYGSEEDELDIEPAALDELKAWNSSTTTFLPGHASAAIPPGPYVFTQGKTWQPWRVYYDFNCTFMTSFRPLLHAVALDSSYGGTNGRVIVPSRCYFSPSRDRPLDGARITVKDNIDIAGHKTTLCNRAWIELYPVKMKHAACVQVLLDAGAVIVGKVKLQAMIMREEPKEAIEFTAPFNPRADGYQVPSGSSHASAAGISSYDWLDFSLGSDTNGSGRKPASYNGCFGLRPSTGIMNTEGVIGQFPLFDMPVFFGRDISRFSQFISVWYGDSPMLRRSNYKSIRILYPLDYLPTSNPAQTALIEKFVVGLESAFGVQRTKVSLAEAWKRDCPGGPGNNDFAEYLLLAGGYPYYRDSYYDLAPFRDEYTQKFGKFPFVQKAMHWQWDVAKTITVEQRDKYWRRSEIYRHWLLRKIFEADSSDIVSVMIFPIQSGQIEYREADIPPFNILPGSDSLNMSPMMRGPEVTAPVGEISYQSAVTRREEPLPIAVSVLGTPGTDLILADIVAKGIQRAGLPHMVKTGRSMY